MNFWNNGNKFKIILAILLLLIVTACSNAKQSEGNSKSASSDNQESEELKLAAIYPLSGPAASWGTNTYRALELGAEKVNNNGGFSVDGKKYKWKIISHDSKFTAQDTVSGTDWAINAEGAKIISTMGTGPTIAVTPTTEQQGILNISIAAPTPEIDPKDMPLTFLGASPVTTKTWNILLGWFTGKKNIKSISVIHTDDLVGKTADQTVREAATELGIEVFASEFVPQDTTDFYPVLTKIIEKNPDMIMTGTLSTQPAASILKQARELGYAGEIYLPWAPLDQQVIEIAGSYADEAYATGIIHWNTESQIEILDRYGEKWDKQEADSTALYYVNMLEALTEAIVEADSLDNKKIAEKFQDKRWDVFETKDMGWGGEGEIGIKRLLDQNMYDISQFKNGEALNITYIDAKE